jgi:hypothetical protein
MKNYLFLNIVKAGIILFVITGAIFLAINIGCNKKSTQPESIVYPDSNLSFIQHIHPIFINNCVSGGCHESAVPAAGLDLETLAPTFNSVDGPVVIPFDANQSRLYRLLLSDYMGIPRMPRGRGPLPDNAINAIGTWINEGASINN